MKWTNTEISLKSDTSTYDIQIQTTKQLNKLRSTVQNEKKEQ